MTVRCDIGFRLEGNWVFKCVFANNKLVLDGELPQCVPLQSGSPTYSIVNPLILLQSNAEELIFYNSSQK